MKGLRFNNLTAKLKAIQSLCNRQKVAVFEYATPRHRVRRQMGQLLSSHKREASHRASRPLAADRPGTDDTDVYLIIGLGNPGSRYADTRHNVGFMTIDSLAKRENINVTRVQENAAVGRGHLCEKRILLAKPLTFMNVSGESVGKLSRFYRIPPERIIVIYDDLDLAPGVVRLRAKGGHGGHNGMKSIQSHLQGSKEFPRIRIGIGRPSGAMSVADYVLHAFDREEVPLMDEAVEEAIQAIRAVLSLGMEKAVSGLRVDANGRQIAPPNTPKLKKLNKIVDSSEAENKKNQETTTV